MAKTEAQQVKKAPRLKGTVVSTAMDKTIVVAVETFKTHPKYLKKYRSTKRYKVHDPENRHKEGETVVFQECRPLSKEKRHIIVNH
jgi:small subunit ribosomal protein S17